MKYKIENYFAYPVDDSYVLETVVNGNGVVEQEELKYTNGFAVYDEKNKKIININFNPETHKWDGSKIIEDVEYIADQNFYQYLKQYKTEKDKVRNFLIDYQYGMAYDENFELATESDKQAVIEYMEGLTSIMSKKTYGILEIIRPKILDNY